MTLIKTTYPDDHFIDDDFIKDNLYNLIDGKLDKEFDFDTEKINRLIELSFLYNHIKKETDIIIFSYDEYHIYLKGIGNIPPDFLTTTITQSFLEKENFKKALTKFLREHKLKNILTQ